MIERCQLDRAPTDRGSTRAIARAVAIAATSTSLLLPADRGVVVPARMIVARLVVAAGGALLIIATWWGLFGWARARDLTP
jgi:hypothetical protein